MIVNFVCEKNFFGKKMFGEKMFGENMGYTPLYHYVSILGQLFLNIL